MSRAQNLRAPIEGAYIPQARRALVAHNLRLKAHDEELEAKRACAQAMSRVSVREFTLEVEGQRYKAKLKRPLAERVSVKKLYTLVREGTLSLDDFLECVTANEKFVEETLGEDRTKALKEEYRKGLDLVFSKIGA